MAAIRNGHADTSPRTDRPTGYRARRAARPSGWVGITLAVLSALVNLAFLAAYPVWGLILIALDILVIYALAMHGRDMTAI